MQIDPAIPANAIIRAAVLRPILGHFAADPARLAPALQRLGLADIPTADGYAQIGLGAYLALFEEAARLSGDPFLGARLGAAIRPGDLGPVGLLFLQSASIWRGLQRLSRLTAALQSRTEIRLRREDGLVHVEYHMIGIDAARYPQDAAFSLAAICQLIRTGFGQERAPEEVHLIQPVPCPDPLERLFGAPVLGGRDANRIICDLREADRFTRREDSDLIGVILRHLGQHMMASGAGSLVDRVRGRITERLGRQPVTLTALAGDLRIAPRSLQRRLAADGTSLGALLTQERRALLARLEAEGIPDRATLARRLGYADATVLWRARRGWGDPP